MNNMDMVWRMLGVDEFEAFNIIAENGKLIGAAGHEGKIANPYYFTDEGLINRYGCLDNGKLADLITGYYKIEKVSAKEDTVMRIVKAGGWVSISHGFPEDAQPVQMTYEKKNPDGTKELLCDKFGEYSFGTWFEKSKEYTNESISLDPELTVVAWRYNSPYSKESDKIAETEAADK